MSALNYSIKDIEEVVKVIDGRITNVDISRLTAPGENFISLVFRVDFQVERDGQTNTISTVAKRLPIGQGPRLHFSATGMRNEINWYTKLLPQIKEFAKEYRINADYYPEYIGSRFSMDPMQKDADCESILIIENLNPEGYDNEDRHIGFDLITTRAILKDLAAFHSIPLIMKFKKPDQFKGIKNFIESHYPQLPPGPPAEEGERPPPPDQKIFEKMLELPACQQYKANIEAMKTQRRDAALWIKAGPEPWNTIIHSDFWVNNIMIKCGGNQTPSVKFVDFQAYVYSSYAKDLVFFLLTSVRNDVLRQQLDQLLRYYYDVLSAILENTKIPELKLSYEDYLEQTKRVSLDSEFRHAVFFSMIIFAAKGTAPDFLAGEGDVSEHIHNMNKNMSDSQLEKLVLITELCGARKWI